MPKPYHTPRSERDDARADSDPIDVHVGSTDLCPEGHCDAPGCYCNRGAIEVGWRALRAAEDLAVREQSADWDRDDERDERAEAEAAAEDYRDSNLNWIEEN